MTWSFRTPTRTLFLIGLQQWQTMDHNLFSLPNWDSHTYTAWDWIWACNAKCCSVPAGRGTKCRESGRRGLWLPGNTVPVGSVNRNLSVLFCCSACVVSRTAALAGCIGQKLVRENPWQGAPRCRVANVATAGFLLSCKKFTWSVRMGWDRKSVV